MFQRVTASGATLKILNQIIKVQNDENSNNCCNGNFLLFLKTCRSNQVHSCHYTGAVFSLHRRSSPFLWVYFALFKKKSKIKPTLCPNSSFLPRESLCSLPLPVLHLSSHLCPNICAFSQLLPPCVKNDHEC